MRLDSTTPVDLLSVATGVLVNTGRSTLYFEVDAVDLDLSLGLSVEVSARS